MSSGSSTIYFSPYPTLPAGELILEADISSLPDALVQTSKDSFVVSEDAEDFSVVIKARVADESSALNWLELDDNSEFETPMENLKSKVGLNIVVSSRTSRLRKLLTESPNTDAEVTFFELDEFQNGKAFTFNPKDYRGKVTLKAHLAFREGENQYLRCGQSNELNLHFWDYESPPGSDIDFRWAKFDEEEKLKPYKNQYFRLMYKPDGSPQLVMNESFENFSYVMKSKTRSGKIATVRETMNHRIASQVWHLLVSDLLTRLSQIPLAEDEDLHEGDLEGNLTPHLISILNEFLAFLNWDDDLMSNVQTLVQRLHSSPSDISTKAGDFVQVRCLAAEPFDDLNKQFLESK